MSEGFASGSELMARLTISAINRAVMDPSCWEEPAVHRALLVSGLSVLTAATKLLSSDLDLA